MSDDMQSAVDAIIQSRKSIRAFKPDPVDPELIGHILEVASRAPSGSNMQPWNVYVLTGGALKRVVDAACKAFDSGKKYEGEYKYYPDTFFEPYLSRRRQMGWSMYGILGIEKGEHEKARLQQKRNDMFFDAPVGLIFTMNRGLPFGCFIEYGMFMDNIMLSAKSHGLDTCPQGGWSDYHEVLREVLPIKPEELVVDGMALGYADTEATIYKLETEREPVSSFTQFIDK